MTNAYNNSQEHLNILFCSDQYAKSQTFYNSEMQQLIFIDSK